MWLARLQHEHEHRRGEGDAADDAPQRAPVARARAAIGRALRARVAGRRVGAEVLQQLAAEHACTRTQ